MGILAAVLLLGFTPLFFVRAADVDGDGVTDIEEVYEFGTDPREADVDVLTQSAETRLASLPHDFTLHGTSLLVVGFAPRREGWVEVRLLDNTEQTRSVLRLPMDERGVFNGLWNLGPVCHERGAGEFTLHVDGGVPHSMRMTCQPPEEYPLSAMTFGSLSLETQGREPLVLASAEEAIFTAVAGQGMRLYVSYASLVFSKDLFAANEGVVRVAPWKYLPPGEHTLTVMPYAPLTRDLYDPVQVRFTLLPPMSAQWQAMVTHVPGSLGVLFIFLGAAILAVRRARPRYRR